MKFEWKNVFKSMKKLALAKSKVSVWKFGQKKSIHWIAEQLGQKGRNGVLVADEVGMGKTRVVMAAILSVLENGGSVAVVVPPGLLTQWKKEWDEFFCTLKDKNKYSPIFLRSYHSLFEDGSLKFPLAQNANKWLLISHQFGAPRLGINSQSKRYLLPVLVKALQKDTQGKKRNNSYWQLVKKNFGYDNCIGADCDHCEENECNSWYAAMNKAAKYLRTGQRWRLFNNIPENGLETDDNKKNFKEWFNGEKGIAMLGELLGSVDFLVIDEAHKNRGEDSRLETNLSKIIKMNEGGKRIAMTATPMELRADQWGNLFERINESCPEKAIKAFDNARRKAVLYPDNQKIILDLIKKSECFNTALEPYVIRRVRIKQQEMLELIGLENEKLADNAHPYRQWKPLVIKFDEIAEEWRQPLFALEAIGKAAKGCKTEDENLNALLGRLKIADSQYAAGQIAATHTLNDSLGKKPQAYENKLDETINEYLKKHIDDSGKLLRIKYWRKILKESEQDLSDHPRIQRTADEIEKIVWNSKGKLSQEKALVFGTFNKPLRALGDVLNRRAVLRFLDRKVKGSVKESPIPAASQCIKDISGIWKEYEKLKKSKIENPCLKRKFNTINDLCQAIKAGGKVYKFFRERLQDHINDEFIKCLPGEASIEDKTAVAKLLRDRLIHELICQGEKLNKLQPDDLKRQAFDIWVEYLESYFDSESESKQGKKNSKTEWKKPGWLNADKVEIKILEDLDRFADNIGYKKIHDLVKNETAHISGRFGFFARRLDGDVKMETRRALQAQFNDGNSFPQVLIAQSQVGREGLNLHKACRTIVQFHSEWNPGVVEQQIGRVDRIENYWQKLAKECKERNEQKTISDDNFPKIIIKPVLFEGTYDHFQYQVLQQRQENFNAHLFGKLLTEEALEKMPTEGEWIKIRSQLHTAVPDFSPPNIC